MDQQGVRRPAKGPPGAVADDASASTEEARRGRPHAGSGGRARTVADAAAARRRAERRAERIGAGVEELGQRLADLLRSGLATADRPGYAFWEETAARMVDAQAPGLAGRVRELGAIPGSGPDWPGRLLEECALAHLLGQAWHRVGALPEPLAVTVRTRMGLPASPGGPPVRDRWSVLARYDRSDGRLTTRRTWLYGQGSGRTALLLSYGAGGRPLGAALPVGAVLDAELTAYPGAGQLRAELGERFGDPAPKACPPPGGTAADALAAYGAALREDPWLESWPGTLAAVVPLPDGDGGWQLAEADGTAAVPVAAAAVGRQGLWRLAAVSGGHPITVFGECGHRGFTPLAAWTTAAGSGPGSGPSGAPPPLVALI
ncbi:hypothetical protein C6N75_16145 [Streptomyces solincola]|uniref:SWIM zinc finger family protein n=1 Tax=Streptomyces solincola TaxID=2100817 RepID=A0A2S9PUV4_9ACTN|nr:hypothetical protein [Streptomyces solincola]PRH78206.1 hypothetical protein C6N75_16145 [Streptomyces solincola]